MSAPNLNPHDERRVAVLAGCDPRTVRAYLNNKSQRSTVAARVRDALRQLGLEPSQTPAPSPAKAA